MISNHWLERRKQHWQRLESLLSESSRNGLNSLTRAELRELGLLYRQTAADLSVLRGDPSARHFGNYLNQLLGRAHNTIYASRKSSPSGVLSFFWREYPRVFRSLLPYTVTALGLFVIGGLAGMFLTIAHPEFMNDFLGPEMVDTIERREMWTHRILAVKPLATSGIMTNNLSVSFTAFAAGIMGGLGTIYMMVFNGVLIGVIGAACWLSGMSLQLWSFVAPHGVIELPAIFIAGGAGLRLGQGLLFPGPLSRRDSVGIAGQQAVRLVVGVIPMLIVAGITEGYLSPTNIPVALKFSVAAVLFAGLIAWLFFTAKDETEAR